MSDGSINKTNKQHDEKKTEDDFKEWVVVKNEKKEGDVQPEQPITSFKGVFSTMINGLGVVTGWISSFLPTPPKNFMDDPNNKERIEQAKLRIAAKKKQDDMEAEELVERMSELKAIEIKENCGQVPGVDKLKELNEELKKVKQTFLPSVSSSTSILVTDSIETLNKKLDLIDKILTDDKDQLKQQKSVISDVVAQMEDVRKRSKQLPAKEQEQIQARISSFVDKVQALNIIEAKTIKPK